VPVVGIEATGPGGRRAAQGNTPSPPLDQVRSVVTSMDSSPRWAVRSRCWKARTVRASVPAATAVRSVLRERGDRSEFQFEPWVSRRFRGPQPPWPLPRSAVPETSHPVRGSAGTGMTAAGRDRKFRGQTSQTVTAAKQSKPRHLTQRHGFGSVPRPYQALGTTGLDLPSVAEAALRRSMPRLPRMHRSQEQRIGARRRRRGGSRIAELQRRNGNPPLSRSSVDRISVCSEISRVSSRRGHR
jgi:hypothetical protein